MPGGERETASEAERPSPLGHTHTGPRPGREGLECGCVCLGVVLRRYESRQVRATYSVVSVRSRSRWQQYTIMGTTWTRRSRRRASFGEDKQHGPRCKIHNSKTSSTLAFRQSFLRRDSRKRPVDSIELVCKPRIPHQRVTRQCTIEMHINTHTQAETSCSTASPWSSIRRCVLTCLRT